MRRLNKIGPPTEYGDFFGREKEICKVNRLLDSNHSFYCPYHAALISLHWRKSDRREKESEVEMCLYRPGGNNHRRWFS
jgi:hypothetical protein